MEAADLARLDHVLGPITEVVNSLSRPFTHTYDKLNYPGFVSVFGAVLVFLPLVVTLSTLSELSFDETRLFILTGASFVLTGAAWISFQNLLTYKLQRAKQEVACRMLAIQVAAMGDIQRAALNEINRTPSDLGSDREFMTK